MRGSPGPGDCVQEEIDSSLTYGRETMSSTDSAPTLRSVPTAEGIAAVVHGRYGLDVTECLLVRSFVNEVYEVRTPESRFVLKLYHHGGWTVDEVGWEAELVDHLVATGIPVPPVVPMQGGRLVGELESPEGIRPFLLSEYVEGSKPRKPFDDELYQSYGRLIGHLHEAGDTFRTDRYRRPFDLQTTLDEPLSRVLHALPDRPDDRRLMENLGLAARERLTQLEDQLDRGVRHGDVTMDNVHRTDHGLVIHDFDLAHVGWRVADLSSCLATPFASAFLAGYQEVRTVTPVDMDALPWLRVVESIENLAFHLTEKAVWRGTETLGEGWIEDGLTELRLSAERLV